VLNLILQQHAMSLVLHGLNGMMGNAAISVAMEREFKVETGLEKSRHIEKIIMLSMDNS
jgi:hypothetical protein